MVRTYNPTEFQAQDGDTIRPGDVVVIELGMDYRTRTVGIYRGATALGLWFEFPVYDSEILYSKPSNVLKKLESAMDLVPDSVREYIPH